MKRLTVLGLVLSILALAALPVQAAIPNRYLGDRAQRIQVTASDVAGVITLPAGKQGVFLILTNDSTESVYLTINVAATTAAGFELKPGEEIQVPVALQSLGYVCLTTKTTLLRGWVLYY